eukprot:Polyplicarium_translucidae@DN3164_c0_g1_i3.p1
MLFGFQEYLLLELRDFSRRFLTTGNVLIDVWVGVGIYQVLFSGNVLQTETLFSLGHLQFDYVENSDTMYFQSVQSPAHKAIMHHVTAIRDSRVKKLSQKRGEMNINADDIGEYELAQDEAVKVDKDVWVRIDKVKETRNTEMGDGKVQVVTRNVNVFSTRQHTAAGLKTWVKKWITEYQDFNSSKIKDVE